MEVAKQQVLVDLRERLWAAVPGAKSICDVISRAGLELTRIRPVSPDIQSNRPWLLYLGLPDHLAQRFGLAP